MRQALFEAFGSRAPPPAATPADAHANYDAGRDETEVDPAGGAHGEAAEARAAARQAHREHARRQLGRGAQSTIFFITDFQV